MKFDYVFRQIEQSNEVTDYAEEKLAKECRYSLKEGVGHVYFSKRHYDYHVEVTIKTDLHYFKASSYADTLFEAIDEAGYKLSRQFNKEKQKVKKHKKYEKSREGRLEQVNSMLEYDFNLAHGITDSKRSA